MTLDEIAEAVGLLHPQNALRICTTMLVTLIHEDTDEFIQLAHFTVKEYLVLPEEAKNDTTFRFTEESAQVTLASTTVKYLLDPGILGKPKPKPKLRGRKTLLEYSASFWYNHAILVAEKDEYYQLMELIDHLFSPEYSASYENWLRTYNCDDQYDWHTRSRKLRNPNYPQPLCYAALLGFCRSVNRLITQGAVIEEEGSTGNALLAATKEGHTTVVQEILQRFPHLTEAEFCRAIKCIGRNAQDIMMIYVEAYSQKTTSKVMEAAASNSHSGEVLITILLNQKGEDIKITSEVLAAAARNWQSGAAIITILLNRRGEDIKITSGVLAAAARNWQSGPAIITILLNRRGEDTKITSEVLVAAASNPRSGIAIVIILLNQKGEDIKITSEVLAAAAGNWQSGAALMTILLNRKGEDIRITSKVIKAAARNKKSGKAVLTLFLDQEYVVKIPQELVEMIIARLDGEEYDSDISTRAIYGGVVGY